MARTIPAGIAADIATGRTTLSRCLRLDLRDGTSVGITDHDADLTVDLGDGALVYSAGIGAMPSAVALAVGLDADSFEVRGPLASPFTRAAVLGGRFHRARARLFDADWSDVAHPVVKLLAGKVAEAKVEGGVFVLGVRSAADAFNQTVGRVLTPYCSHDFGVGQCQAVPAVYAGEVTAVAGDMRFTVAFDSPAPSADDVRGGRVTFTTGALTGDLPVELFALAGGVVDLYAPLSALPQVGDLVEIEEGCDKLRATCKIKGQILNNGGFPDLTGSDDYLKYPAPGG